jgi:hypothetical protein
MSNSSSWLPCTANTGSGVGPGIPELKAIGTAADAAVAVAEDCQAVLQGWPANGRSVGQTENQLDFAWIPPLTVPAVRGKHDRLQLAQSPLEQAGHHAADLGGSLNAALAGLHGAVQKDERRAGGRRTRSPHADDARLAAAQGHSVLREPRRRGQVAQGNDGGRHALLDLDVVGVTDVSGRRARGKTD